MFERGVRGLINCCFQVSPANSSPKKDRLAGESPADTLWFVNSKSSPPLSREIAMTNLDFAVIDVFAESPLSGNPLAIVSGGDGLPDDVLRAVAREFNQAETTFVL